jgi:hypothetical protein
MRVALPHLGQSVDLDVSIAFFRSPVFAILAMDPDFSPCELSLLTPFKKTGGFDGAAKALPACSEPAQILYGNKA